MATHSSVLAWRIPGPGESGGLPSMGSHRVGHDWSDLATAAAAAAVHVKVKVKVNQSCQTLCDPMNCIVHGILQARILEWVAFPFSRGCSQPRDWTQVSHIAGGFFTSWATREAQEFYGGGGLVAKSYPTLVTPWTVARQLCPWTLKVKENFPWWLQTLLWI